MDYTSKLCILVLYNNSNVTGKSPNVHWIRADINLSIISDTSTMKLPSDNNLTNVPKMETKMKEVLEVPRGVNMFYLLHNSRDIKEILNRGLNRTSDCGKR